MCVGTLLSFTSASANDSLNVNKVEAEPISQVTRSKSGSSHSLTATIVRGLQASFRYMCIHVGHKKVDCGVCT